jgi:hypothetical protein
VTQPNALEIAANTATVSYKTNELEDICGDIKYIGSFDGFVLPDEEITEVTFDSDTLKFTVSSENLMLIGKTLDYGLRAEFSNFEYDDDEPPTFIQASTSSTISFKDPCEVPFSFETQE